MPLLVVVRHAKAAHPADREDAERPLAPRGFADARAAGRWVLDTVGPPARLLVSPARRALQTAQELQAAWDGGSSSTQVEVVADERIYAATAEDLLAVVREGGDVAGPVCLVGHNPSVSHLSADLAPASQPFELATAGVAVIELPGAWADVDWGTGTLVATTTARG